MTPLERAARALCKNPDEDPETPTYMMDGTTIPRWQAEVWRAQAVLQAIREPIIADAQRLEHGTFCNVRDRYPCSCGLDNFKARLAAALEGK